MSDRNRWGTNILLGLSSSLLVFMVLSLLGEWMVRYRERNRDTVPGTFASLYYQHRRLHHALIRDREYYGWVHINRFGFRGPDFELDGSSDVIRILTVGGSTTFDRGVTSDARTWPARLEHWLNETGVGRRVEVLNAGVPGYRVLDNMIRLQTELHRFQPDVIILYHAHNDLIGALRPRRLTGRDDLRRPDEMKAQWPWTRWLTRNSLLYVKIQARIAALRPVRADDTQPNMRHDADVSKRAAEGFERDLTSFLAIAEGLGIRVVLPAVVQVSGDVMTETNPAIRRSWERSVSFTTPDEMLAGYVSFNDVIRRVAQKFDAIYVATEGFGLSGTKWYEDDDPVHFNDAGAERMAKHMAAALVEQGLLIEHPQFSFAH